MVPEPSISAAESNCELNESQTEQESPPGGVVTDGLVDEAVEDAVDETATDEAGVEATTGEDGATGELGGDAGVDGTTADELAEVGAGDDDLVAVCCAALDAADCWGDDETTEVAPGCDGAVEAADVEAAVED